MSQVLLQVVFNYGFECLNCRTFYQLSWMCNLPAWLWLTCLVFQASSSCDGSVRVWRLSDKREVVSWACVPKSNSFQHASSLGRTAWTPNSGEHLAVPDHSHVRLYLRDSWENTVTLSNSSSSSQVSKLRFKIINWSVGLLYVCCTFLLIIKS